MLNHVLVPLDGSALGEEALAVARQSLAPGGTITLLTAVDLPQSPLYGDLMLMTPLEQYEHTLQESIQRAKDYLTALVDNELMRTDAVKIDYVVRIGKPAETIVEVATQNEVDAIVMSTHGRSGLSRWLFGSVTSKVLGLSNRPVLVIPSANKAQLLEIDKPELNYG